MRNKGWSRRELVTVVGELRARRRYYWCETCRQGTNPDDQRLGLDKGAWSGGLREWMTMCGMSWSFGQAAKFMYRLTGVRCCRESVRAVTLEEGNRVRRQWDMGGGDWKGQVEGQRVYVFADGVQTPLREGWKELKIGMFYEPQSGLKDCVVEYAEPEEFMVGMRAEAIRLGVCPGAELTLLADGAPWIWNHGSEAFPEARQTLDFYHAGEHVSQCAQVLYGEGTAQTKAWSEAMRGELKEAGGKRLIEELGSLKGRFRKRAKRKALESLENYLRKNADRVDYPAYLSAGYLIGSGPVESQCKQIVGLRLKLPGARWRQSNALSVATLRATFNSRQWDAHFPACA